MTEPQKAERDAFENWLIREKGHFPDAIERMRDGDRYWHEPIQRLWEAWQAAFETRRSAKGQELRGRLVDLLDCWDVYRTEGATLMPVEAQRERCPSCGSEDRRRLRTLLQYRLKDDPLIRRLYCGDEWHSPAVPESAPDKEE